MASVAFLVKTISLLSEALMKRATFFLASSNSSVALALQSIQTTFYQNPLILSLTLKTKRTTLSSGFLYERLNYKTHSKSAKLPIQQQASEKSQHCPSTQALSHSLPEKTQLEVYYWR